ncbi:MAG: VWA domain-containing protein, partial [Bacteroidetes bacterium]|nr:VWA domain-containing protein [Bacteroidota bacterium]
MNAPAGYSFHGRLIPLPAVFGHLLHAVSGLPLPATASLRAALAGILLLLLTQPALSQPVLNFKRVTVNWPTIELYFAVDCDGQAAYRMAKENWRIYENGEAVPDFTLWCPDPFVRCAGSFAFVADASGSMRGSAMDITKRNLHAFIDLMDGSVDESALIEVRREPVVAQSMTTIIPFLRTAVDNLQARGASSLYDGIEAGINELINNGTNQCRAVLVFSDGWDNMSTATAQEIISLANRNRIRVFTIGVGNNVAATELEMIALLTGGRYFQNPDIGQMATIYADVNTIIFQGFQECVMTYERVCADGSPRTIDLQLVDFCGGEDVKAKTYRAPLDSSTWVQETQRFRIGERTSIPTDFISIPVTVDHPSTGIVIRPFDMAILPGSPHRPLLDVVIPPGSPFHGKAVTVHHSMDSVFVRLDETVPALAGDTLLLLRFGTASVFDGWYPLAAEAGSTRIRCTATEILAGGYRIVPRREPRIDPGGEVMICPGSGTELHLPEGYVRYRWSTGDITR